MDKKCIGGYPATNSNPAYPISDRISGVRNTDLPMTLKRTLRTPGAEITIDEDYYYNKGFRQIPPVGELLRSYNINPNKVENIREQGHFIIITLKCGK